jgi:hypothetical protein
MMAGYEQDLAYFRAGIEDLQDYLLSKELYWPLSGDMPRLTLGGLLLALYRIRARQQRNIQDLTRQLNEVHAKWRVAWENKAIREIHARLDLWRNYLLDYRADPDEYANAYPHEVQYRTMVDLLAEELPSTVRELDPLVSLDRILKGYFVPGLFVWETGLASSFPRDEYWFLYGKLKA